MATVVKISFKGWDNLTLSQLKIAVKQYYKTHFLGKQVYNKDIGITVNFSMKGINHLIYARGRGQEKLIAVRNLDTILEQANFSNFKGPDANDPKDILGYYNFNCKILVLGKVHNFRLSVRITKMGKFYYDHAVRIKK